MAAKPGGVKIMGRWVYGDDAPPAREETCDECGKVFVVRKPKLKRRLCTDCRRHRKIQMHERRGIWALKSHRFEESRQHFRKAGRIVDSGLPGRVSDLMDKLDGGDG